MHQQISERLYGTGRAELEQRKKRELLRSFGGGDCLGLWAQALFYSSPTSQMSGGGREESPNNSANGTE
jgi:hypothetical protein